MKWKGYGEGEISWEPAAHLKNVPVRVKAFHKANPAAPRPANKDAFATVMWKPLPPLDESLTDGLNPKTGLAREIPDWEGGKLKGREKILDEDVGA